MKIRTITTALICIIALSSCVHVKEMGQLSIISSRNIEPTVKYKSLQAAPLTPSERKKSRYRSLSLATDATIKKIEGGEYLMNARVYLIVRSGFFKDTYFYAVEGDIWGQVKK